MVLFVDERKPTHCDIEERQVKVKVSSLGGIQYLRSLIELEKYVSSRIILLCFIIKWPSFVLWIERIV